MIGAAGRRQGVLAGWVYQHVGWPRVAALLVLIVGAFAGAWYRRARR